MGGVKRMMEEDMERGFSRVEASFVCLRCVEDDGLKAFIKDNSVRGTCSYCNGNRRVADMNDVIELSRMTFSDGDQGGLGGHFTSISDLRVSHRSSVGEGRESGGYDRKFSGYT